MAVCMTLIRILCEFKVNHNKISGFAFVWGGFILILGCLGCLGFLFVLF